MFGGPFSQVLVLKIGVQAKGKEFRFWLSIIGCRAECVLWWECVSTSPTWFDVVSLSLWFPPHVKGSCPEFLFVLFLFFLFSKEIVQYIQCVHGPPKVFIVKRTRASESISLEEPIWEERWHQTFFSEIYFLLLEYFLIVQRILKVKPFCFYFSDFHAQLNLCGGWSPCIKWSPFWVDFSSLSLLHVNVNIEQQSSRIIARNTLAFHKIIWVLIFLKSSFSFLNVHNSGIETDTSFSFPLLLLPF